MSVRQIETLTGLDFPEQTGRANPIFFSPSDAARELNVNRFPEINEVDAPRDIVDPGQVRVPLADPDPGVRILAAMVNPRGSEAENEWVSLANLSAEAVTVDGWTLTDIHSREHRVGGAIGPGAALRVQPLLPMRLANSQDGSLALFDADGARVHRVAYTEDQARKEGAPVVFFTPGRFDVMGSR